MEFDIIVLSKNFNLKKSLILFFLCCNVFFINETAAQTKVEFNDKSSLVKSINDKYQSGNWEGGKVINDEALTKYPKDSDLRMLLGKYYVNGKNYDKARFELNKAIEYNNANVDAKQLLVGVETETKRYSSAICYVNELLEVNPYWKGLWRKKIDLYRLQGNNIEANRLLKRISQIFPNDKKIEKDIAYETSQNALKKSKEGKIDEAIKLNSELVNDDAGNSENYVSLIDNYIKAGDYNQALVTANRGLNKFPGSGLIVQKKISLLEQQKKYDELLPFIQSQIKKGNNQSLRKQYSYFLLEAARYSKEKDPATLYGKILDSSPGNNEAFNYVFNQTMGAQQYDQALYLLNKYRKVRGNSKNSSLNELRIYRRMDDEVMVAKLSKQLFAQYPNDEDIKEQYVSVILQEAKTKMDRGTYLEAIPLWKEIIANGKEDMYSVGQMGLFNAYYNSDQFIDALNVLNEIISNDPRNVSLFLKRSDLYFKQKRYDIALESYEKIFAIAESSKKNYYLTGYGDLMGKIIKDLIGQYKYPEALVYVEKWIAQDPENKDALMYAINFSSKTNDLTSMEKFAKLANQVYPNDVVFKVKLAEAMQKTNQDFSPYWLSLKQEIEINPYNDELSKAFVGVSTTYGEQLVKNRKLDEALVVYNEAIIHDQKNKELKYLKGVVFEKIKQNDSAYYYQSFYEPSLLEVKDFKQHLYTLSQKSSKNEIGIYHLRARYGDDYRITSVSTIEYTRKGINNIYVGRINYAGRDTGRGLQAQAEWSRVFSDDFSGKVDFAVSDRFFPKINANLSIYKNIFKSYQLEAGIGYRKLYTSEKLSNFVLGVTKELENFRLNARYNQFLLDGKLLYNLSAQGRYFMEGPKNYLFVTGSIGSSPDVELIDNQFYNSFSAVNTMVGTGFGHIISKNVSAGILGTWYNFNSGTNLVNPKFRNLYNLYFQLNVSF
ncbi:YaiO family outer membrane beta-barrel protein [Pedobacter changchengzhani]|uniref:YaiO family outer membrane beta-barrel protein n=1 Tax=Pedobacter changchengzhani TaxID=2529274 RepID=A0A4R5MLU1_9SPHI|nr:tetratricopeptide repeat protein [Pedobacter changchengzhani]TDG36602.1 YaiO family outer membrane beta-barrel protein [Pedobacter changchengzhani]